MIACLDSIFHTQYGDYFAVSKQQLIWLHTSTKREYSGEKSEIDVSSYILEFGYTPPYREKKQQTNDVIAFSLHWHSSWMLELCQINGAFI